MIYVFSEIKGYVVGTLEGPAGFDVLAERRQFFERVNTIIAKRPVWVSSHGESRHEEYQVHQQKYRDWELEQKMVMKEVCGDFTDPTEAFLNHLIVNRGFRRHEFEQIELS